ncbi:MAG: hypothetical protein U5K79_04605 [Cyclobacteriaceae bacterium]|nr:hypothetical protein [Cyclobacteriaceae bacterium]
MTQPSLFHPASSDLLPLTQIPLRHRKSVLEWLDTQLVDRQEKPSISQDLYEFWLDNLSNRSSNEFLMDF